MSITHKGSDPEENLNSRLTPQDAGIRACYKKWNRAEIKLEELSERNTDMENAIKNYCEKGTK